MSVATIGKPQAAASSRIFGQPRLVVTTWLLAPWRAWGGFSFEPGCVCASPWAQRRGCSFEVPAQQRLRIRANRRPWFHGRSEWHDSMERSWIALAEWLNPEKQRELVEKLSESLE